MLENVHYFEPVKFIYVIKVLSVKGSVKLAQLFPWHYYHCVKSGASLYEVMHFSYPQTKINMIRQISSAILIISFCVVRRCLDLKYSVLYIYAVKIDS